MVRRLLALFVVMVFASPALAFTTRHVNHALGNDLWDGAASIFTGGTTGPWRTIAHANATLLDGETVRVAPNDTIYDAPIMPGNLSGDSWYTTPSTTWIGDSGACNTVIVPGANVWSKHTTINGFRIAGDLSTGPSTTNKRGKYLHLRNCVVVGGLTLGDGTMTIRSNRIGTDSSQCNWTCQSVSANQDSNDFEDNVVRLRYDINHITSEEKLMNWEQDNHVTDTSEVSRHWTVARNKVRLTIPVEFVTAGKPIMWNRISASSWHDNFWEVRDSSKREGLQWVMRDHIQYNRFQCDTFVIINLSGGSTRFFMHGSGNGMYPTPGGNVFNQCVFWSNMDLAGAPPFFFESAIFSGDSISRCLFQGSANTSILAVDGLKFGTAAIYRNTIVNMGNGPAFETAKNSDTSNPCGWDTTDSLSVKGNIFYSPRNTPFTMAFPANGQGRVRSDCNVFGEYITNDAIFRNQFCATGSYKRLTIAQECADSSIECHSILGSPRFVDSTATAVRLFPDSSAMDAPFYNPNCRIAVLDVHLTAGSAAYSRLASIGKVSPIAAGCFDSTGDITLPGTVNDLVAAGSTSESVILTFIAPGDNNFTCCDTVASYDFRYSTVAITNANWSTATPFTVPASATLKSNPGSVQPVNVTGLGADTQYYFALKATDFAGNVSLLSNVASMRTQQAGVPGHVEP